MKEYRPKNCFGEELPRHTSWWPKVSKKLKQQRNRAFRRTGKNLTQYDPESIYVPKRGLKGWWL